MMEIENIRGKHIMILIILSLTIGSFEL